MVEVEVYIAHSVDGYIADAAGTFDFLKPFDGYDFGYDAFYAKVDAVVMGRLTYQDCRTFPAWPYQGRSAVVMTKGPPLDGDGLAVFSDATAAEIVQSLVHAGRKRIWVVGGGGPIRAFLDARLVDRMHLFQMPVLLGAGTPLFPQGRRGSTLKFQRSAVHRNGVVETEYALGGA